jgi:protoporphyrinogen oxidase
MKIGILGAGISGLSVGKLLQKNHQVELLEQDAIHGGIARTKDIGGIAYHTTGGHCFNSKYPEVLDFVFSEILPKNEWHNVRRNANIILNNMDIPYPIEFAVKEIFRNDPDLAIKITRDFLNVNDNGRYDDLESWFRKKFGDTLSECYFIPYNRKIWGREPSSMSPLWVEEKLPIPNKESFFQSLIGSQSDHMPHATFYYPKTNNQNTFIDNLASGLNITTNYCVQEIQKDAEGKWIINRDKEYDLLISTIPLNLVPSLISGVDQRVVDDAQKLRYNKVTTMIWETEATERTWTYVPSAGNIFHRYIHIGNFFQPRQNVSITEAVGERTYDQMVSNGLKDPFFIRPLGYHVSGCAYVVFDENYLQATTDVKSYLTKLGMHVLGRFGEWEYYNMDICIKRSIEIAKLINGK